MVSPILSAIRRLGAAALALVVGLAAASAVAQGTPVGTEVVNIAHVTWQVGGIDQGEGLSPEARFTVARPQSSGVLTAWELDKGLTDGPFETILFPGAEYWQNAWLPLPEPVDRSTLTGTPTPVDRSAPLRVFRTDRIRLGVPVFFTLEDSGLNLVPSQIETAIVTLTDALTGDSETLRLYETGPDTGVFTGWINTINAPSPSGDGQLATQAFSVITVRYEAPGNPNNNLVAEIHVGQVNPSGLVFDSQSGAPLSGVELTLIDMATGAPAHVFGDDMAAQYPPTLVTGGQVTDSAGQVYEFPPGAYRFPYVAPGRYRIEIAETGLDSHRAPSLRSDAALQALPGAPFALVAGSRLEPFDVVPGLPMRIDIPMDALAIAQITRDASHSKAAIGEFFEYRVTVTVSEGGALTIYDTLPDGVAFVPGTLLIDGQPLTPQILAGGRRLAYALPSVLAGQTIIATYGAQVVPPAQPGQVLLSGSEIQTAGTRRLRADHALRVRDALGLDQVAILGQISAGGCGGANPGYDLSGIRVLLENGEFAVTDSDGRFTFRDIYRRPRVVQMDVTTLPDGARPVLCYASTRSAGSAISQFVELRPGMMGRVEFYLEFDPEDESAFDPAPPPAPAEADRSPLVRFDQDWLNRHGARHGAGFLAPAHGHLPRSEAIDVVYLRPVGAKSELLVNDEAVPGIRREPTLRSSDGRWEMIRYRAVRIGEGRNALALVITGSNGQVSHRQTHDVLYGLRPAQLELVRAASTLESDGRSQPQITLRLTDRAGIPIRPGTQVTVMIEAPFGFAPTGPVRRSSPASERAPRSRITATVQNDGIIPLTLAPTLEGGAARLSIAATGRELSVRVPISAAARPWVLVGLAEGTLAHKRVRDHMRRDGEIGNALSGRVALFAEGLVKGEWLMTLRYDSAQDSDSFYGIDPDAEYIVYGDRSTQGNAAQSRFPLYLRLRREGAEFLIGDFNTNLNAGGIAINHEVTGARAVFEDEHWRVMAFAAQVSNALVEDRIPLNGTVGPYPLSRTDIIPHSQTVLLVTVSRFDASEELQSRTLAQGLDYVLSYTTGQLFLRRPIPAFTPELHRNILVVDYEADEDLRNGLIAGIRAEAELSPRLRAAVTAVHARRVEGQALSITLSGFDLSYRATDELTLSAEMLHARRSFATHSDTGLRSEVRAEFERDGTQVVAYLRRQRGHVALTASDADIDTIISGLSLRHQLWADPETPSERWLLEGQLLAENDRANDVRRRDGEVLLTRERERKTQSLGFRGIHTNDATGLTRDLRLVYRGIGTSEDGRLTQALGTEVSLRPDAPRAGDKLDLTFGYLLTERWSVFGTFEVESQRQTSIEARRFTFGAEFTPEEGRAYRTALSWAGDGQNQGQALFLGADHGYTLREGLTAYLGGDVQWDLGAAGVPMGQSIGNPYIAESFIALRAGLRHEAESWGAGADTEWRRTRDTDTGNLRLRMDGELSETWSAGAEGLLGLTRNSGADWRHDLKLLASAAHRAGPRDPITLLQGELRQRDQDGVESLSAIGSVYRSQYLSDTEFLNLRYGLKYDHARLSSGTVNDVLNLVGAEYRRDISEQFDIGVHASMLHAARTGRMSNSLGLSMGLTPFDNGWLSLGYNFTGFHDPDFSALGHTDAGPFVQFRMKFDADSLRGMFK
ncbi:hypothetical protein [Roseinatronobacter alkalisoli]|uniref:DUF11 domain-containing protein n=1 Tax=Roseinatronobacter alkalisoli TaxID=3028235 RepID=A0ABT5TF32_9RHOB|nr:hypothetical protein [Roseinatronobacter sp. HJB301]MDD7972976.1 hypothetical protein [Roseinatronobacter sp. HJB301]